MKSKHTQGPWKVLQDQGRNAVYAKAVRVTLIDPHFGVTGEEFANARLIAAAPELLAQLKEAARVLKALDAQLREEYNNPVQAEGVWRHAQNCFNAIAKAEGNA